MERMFQGALSRAAARVVGSRFAKPIARVALAAAGLALLAFVGRTAVAGAGAASATAAAPAVAIATLASAASSETPPAPGLTAGPAASSPTVPHAHASPDDPVLLNAATETELRRLPGIGAKRADAILALRTRLGRFRAVEDLLKVKGIGRAMLKRLRPLIRLDSPAGDAGLPRPATSSPP